MIMVLALFFGVIIGVNLLLAWFAVESWSGMTAKNGYVASIDFEGKRQAFERQEKRGWRSTMVVKNGQLTFVVRDKAGNPIRDLHVTAFAGRTVTEAEDQQLKLAEVKPGTYQATFKGANGIWQFDLHARLRNGEKYRKVYRVDVKP